MASNYTAAVDPALAAVEDGKTDFGEMWPEMKKQDRLPVAAVRVVATERVVVTPAPQTVETTEPGTVRGDAAVPGHRRQAALDVCERHHLHKVITNGGRSWRCREGGMKRLTYYDPNNPFYVDKAIKKAERRLEEMQIRRRIWSIDKALRRLEAIRSLYAPPKAST